MTLALNYLIAFLLLVTIIFCWKLNKKIVAIHKSKREMLALLKCFDNAVLRAEESIKQLKLASTSAGKTLQTDIEKAKFLMDDLNFMIERAATATDKLENSITSSRSNLYASSTMEQPQRPAYATPSFRLSPSSKLTTPKPAVMDTPTAEKNATQSKRSSIEILLERLAGKQTPSPRISKGQRIPYKSPEELGALETAPTAKKTGKDLMQLLQNAQ